MPVSKAEIQRRMQSFQQTCRSQGLKLTHQRTEIFRELAGTEQHPDAECIYQAVRKRVPAVSRDTVYRTLATLEDKGLVLKAPILYERARYDANTQLHHHFVCTKCGLVRDFYSKALDSLKVPQRIGSLGRVSSAHVQLRGVCSACSAKSKKTRKT